MMTYLRPLLVSVLAASMVWVMAQDEAFAKYDQPVTLDVPVSLSTGGQWPDGTSPTDNIVAQFLKDTLNIDITHTWESTSNDQQIQKTELAIASGKLPDAMIVTGAQLSNLVEAELLEDLTPYYEANTSDQLKNIYEQTDGVALARATFDGKLMAMPAVYKIGDSLGLLWIRQDWLDKLGLEQPSTLDEVKAVAEAFVNNDPDGNGENDTIGISAEKNWQTSLAPLFGAFNSYPKSWVTGSDGAVTYGTVDPATKEALATIQDWYQAGLIDPEFATLSGEAQVEKISAGKVGIVFGPWWYSDWPLKFTLENIPYASWVPILAPLARDGNFHAYVAPNTGRFLVVRKGYEHPEAVIRVLNQQAIFENSEPGSTTINPEEANTYYQNNIAWSDLWPFSGNSVTRPDWLPYNAQLLQEAIADPAKAEQLGADGKKRLASLEMLRAGGVSPADWGFGTAWDKGVPLLGDSKLVLHQGVYQADDVTAESRIWPTLQKIEDQQILSIITGQASLDSFDDLVKQWNSQGGEDITNEIRARVGN